ncbi:MAG: succinate dehydrogenase, cytochrome b556 subunit [Gammaproteobacteria bacterium]|nr:succinate dehydrogenase, cytochrome b556 subunit [Gammaproteobacteria bacterium]MBP6052902.1 succinate dehydrogenase, cytochrome b556 subunit [Pseudomonadales bacterium]MBK6581982.1 succinate dehydrogenase, cytochrome b556 subunit [Gammaproteobacteria bacterium]MBK7728272.1 succinate dehydrogenase, cytochrome b556 subunit [Gammaproteobacteria bacterium]MBK8308433.1 succinate dehydrogenase, cytochrome b556 subunit [Gammaproteobacteria bacterium]
MKPNRPVNLDMGTINLPIGAKASILHRATGVFLFVGIAVLLCLLGLSLDSAEGFARVRELLGSTLAKFVLWAVLAGLIYHSVAGVKHLFMDFGIGDSLAGGVRAARITFTVAAVLIVLAGVWIW